MEKNLEVQSSSISNESFDVAVIGAGISGCLVAKAAAVEGNRVCIIDKARGSGGRLSAKRIALNSVGAQNHHSCAVDGEPNWVSFDLGCGNFSLTLPETISLVDEWKADELVHELGESTYQPLKRSSFLTRSLIAGIKTFFSTKIDRIEKLDNHWRCFTTDSDVEQLVLVAKKLVLALPAPQAANLIPSGPFKLPIQSVHYEPQWVVMTVLPEDVDLTKLENEVFFNGDIAQISCDSNKPGRTSPEGFKTWVIQFSPQWTHKHINWPKEAIEEHVGVLLSKIGLVMSVYAHRWLYSQIQNGLHTTTGTLEVDKNLYAVGDWLFKKGQNVSIVGVESAILSANRLIDELVGSST